MTLLKAIGMRLKFALFVGWFVERNVEFRLLMRGGLTGTGGIAGGASHCRMLRRSHFFQSQFSIPLEIELLDAHTRGRDHMWRVCGSNVGVVTARRRQ